MINYGSASSELKNLRTAVAPVRTLSKLLQELAFPPERLTELKASPYGQKLLDYFDLGCLMLDLTVGKEIVLKIARKFDQHATRNVLFTLLTKQEFQNVTMELQTFLFSTLVEPVELPESSVEKLALLTYLNPDGEVLEVGKEFKSGEIRNDN